MQLYCVSLTEYHRLPTREVKIGNLLMGNLHPILIQTMTTTDTMDTIATVEQSIRCIEAGAELVRITAPNKREAENLLNIKNELRRRGYTTPLVADIHFTPNAAEIAARIVEKVRVNPGNYVDKKKFELIEYTDADYAEEIERIRERFTPLIKICKEYGTAMRIGTNHGSLSDRIMSRYGDTPMGMVESAMEFLRIARSESYHNIVLSMKASNPKVMVHAYRLLVNKMFEEFGECYPLHLGVTEAGDGEDGRVKSGAGIGTLMEDGLGDTIRVSLTEDPEFEIPVCKDLVKRYEGRGIGNWVLGIGNSEVGTRKSEAEKLKVKNQKSNVFAVGNTNEISVEELEMNGEQLEVNDEQSETRNEKRETNILPYSPFNYNRRETFAVSNIGDSHVPVVVADFSKLENITPQHLEAIGYSYNAETHKWNIGDAAADFIFTNKRIDFELPGTLRVVCYHKSWLEYNDKEKYLPILDRDQYMNDAVEKSSSVNFVMLDCYSEGYMQPPLEKLFDKLRDDKTAVICLSSTNKNAMQSVRRMFVEMMNNNIKNPVILITDSNDATMDESLIHYAAEAGGLLLDGFCDGVCLGYHFNNKQQTTNNKLLNSIAFGILQATRTRISKTEYISCPSCGRTLFDLQETTAKIRSRTNHLKGVKIAIMGCIVNGPGEMADADFGYVGSGVGKITLYKGKDVVKRNVNNEVAVDELINLLKENGAWAEPVEVLVSS